MSIGAVFSILLAAAVVAYVAAPLVRRDAAEEERASRAAGETIDLRSEKDMILASLKDLEDDHDTGKVERPDYEELKRKLTDRAIEIMKRLDELEARRGADNVSDYPRRRGPMS
jgi:hypothetical protein